MKKIATTILSGLVGVAFAAPAQATVLIGQEVTYCTHSAYLGVSPSLDPGQCNNSIVFTAGTATITNPGIEINLAGNRFIDLTDGLLTITYGITDSPSPDLFVLTGLSGIGGLSVISDDLGVQTIFSDTSIGLLISGSPLGPGTARYTVLSAVGNVPEPSTWAMMLIGFGGVGVALRRRRTSAGIAQLA